NRTAGAWVVGIGLLLFVVGVAYDLMLDLELMPGIAQITNGYYYGFTGLTVAMATYLSQSFAKTSENLVVHERRLREEEITRRLLEADVARKTRELEEARALQLSMLPRNVPQSDRFVIAVHMQTASEVGGDYYDFHFGDAEDLTIVIGDATGHGLKAGVMVAIAKSLFKAGLPRENFPEFFNACNRILRQMYLGNLFMAMTLVRIEKNRLTVSAAGMPPLLLYRAGSDEVEDVILKGMPLGAFEDFPYEQFETDLAPGDALLLLTDGLTELFDGEREMFGLERARNLWREAARRQPAEVIARLEEVAARWRGNRPQEDDMTLVAVKIK
ncbi:MAG TPA: PP2C family protein-serine/threonine phosphatase, partial [Rhodothermia bacterium]